MSFLALLATVELALVSGQHCASMWEHNNRGGAEYKIILNNGQKETSNLRGYWSIDGKRKRSWWDDRITSFQVQPGCKLSLWCGYDKKTCYPFPCNHNTYFMKHWEYDNTYYNLINSWNDCVSKFACDCDDSFPGAGRRLDGNGGEEPTARDAEPADEAPFVQSKKETLQEEKNSQLMNRVFGRDFQTKMLDKLDEDDADSDAGTIADLERKVKKLEDPEDDDDGKAAAEAEDEDDQMRILKEKLKEVEDDEN